MVGRTCSICSHQKRKEIDKAIAEPGSSIRGISRKYKLSEDALKRHLDNGHIADKIIKAQRVCDMIESDDFLAHVQKKRTRFQEMAEDAKKEANPHLELKIYQVESKFIEIEGKALGAFREHVELTGKDGTALNPVVPAIVMSEDTMRQIGDILAAAKAAKSKEKKV